MMFNPGYGAIVVGGVAGAISAIGFAWLSGALRRVSMMHDTCGVHNIHGMPGILGGIVASIATSRAGFRFTN